MTDAEISRRLALAIGWESDQMTEYMGSLYVADWPRKDNRKTVLLRSGCYPPPLSPWDKFDYRDPAVIWPIAEAYNCFPEKYRANRYPGADEILWSAKGVVSDTAAKAVALAVIKHCEGGKTS